MLNSVFGMVLKRSLSAHSMQVKIFLSLLVVDYMHFLLANRLNACQIFGWFGFQKLNLNRFSVFCTPLVEYYEEHSASNT